ncbi:MAG: Serine-tRNA ligase [Parcubacteria group bacterium GW2011_GWD2_38_12]|nr:MAG: Serine-tRNA ligase [Parcubacteria group bacterium GW2011_GWC2_36_17]KKQ39411.1 MAG: Serine-tRNA ligase [Candidatus Moranbacteria bacterium GW2011_GWF2_37_7]KKQ43914.1 MAG: Serine-tRNA ligase [Parcubacteria group bacterium GW2011_GWE2_37_8]KKQ52844.1 MAG: Serine-tRNA ligase [Parcubacteria group bacterium GW2011_GWD2_38_12]KKQ59047.1 MAG: Serine-tRNA ligase [Parcubacteria group bacterium GW2011_GWC1_38_17]KKQ59662.1 MAG: Serine-tRNA ligase [Parcubacteria group bacterium GW2011_GWD1_38_16
MIDIDLLRKNPETFVRGSKNKNINIDIDEVLELDKRWRDVLRETEDMRAKQNFFGEGVSSEKSEARKREMIEELKNIKDQIKTKEIEESILKEKLDKMIRQIPNPPFDGVIIGKDENDNKVLREIGLKPFFNFKFKNYIEIGEELDLIDTERAAKVSGTRFGYLKGGAAVLEFALIQYAFDILMKEGFVPIVPPVLVKPEAIQAMGYVERGGDEIYFLEKDNIYLVGTSEQSIGPMHKDEIFEEKELPKRYVAFSSCFRREAGSHGKDTRGILRVHQFDKLEMFCITTPEKSKEEHQFLLSLEERLMQGLKIPYRVLDICSGDLGDPAAAKYDIEAWIPSQDTYRETHSSSNTTDFQSRRLNIRYRPKGQEKGTRFVHMLNGTAFAIGRMIIAILENYQQADGSIVIPEVLQKYMPGHKDIISKK